MMKSIVLLKALAFPVLVHSNTNLRGNENKVAALTDSSPKLSECLLSAVSDDDCGKAVEGCVWCAEPIYGLCLTPVLAQKVRWMPFFTCTFPDDVDAQHAVYVENAKDVEIRLA
jgi:hypothetical protein